MRFRGVFFDLYGTLLRYGDMAAAWSAWLAAMHAELTRLGAAIGLDELSSACDGIFSRPQPASGGRGLTVYEARLADQCLRIGFDPSARELARLAECTAEAWQEFIPLDAEAPAVLAELRRSVKLTLVTNFDHPPHVHRLLDLHDLTHLFDQVVVSADEGVKKPDPRIFKRPLEALALDPGEVAYVGDSQDDVDAARSAGLIPLLLARDPAASWAASDFRVSPAGGPSAVSGAAVTIRSLREVIPLVS